MAITTSNSTSVNPERALVFSERFDMIADSQKMISKKQTNAPDKQPNEIRLRTARKLSKFRKIELMRNGITNFVSDYLITMQRMQKESDSQFAQATKSRKITRRSVDGFPRPRMATGTTARCSTVPSSNVVCFRLRKRHQTQTRVASIR